MKIRLRILDLILVLLATIACLMIILKPNLLNSILRTILIIILVLFLSGYSLIAALYPRRNDLDRFERLALSFGFPLIGFAIVIVLTNMIPSNYMSLLQYNLNIILEALALLTIVLSITAIIRRKKVADEDKYVYSRVNEVKNAIKPDLYGKTESENIKFTSTSKKDSSIEKLEVESNSKTEKIKNNYPKFVSKDLVLIFLTTVLTFVFVVTLKLNNTLITTILGLLFVLFIPGYTLITALFPKKDSLDGIERISLSFGLSIGLAALFGLILKYSLVKHLPYILSQLTILNYTLLTIMLSAFTLVMLLIAFMRRRRVPEGEKFYVNFGGFISSIKDQFKGESRTCKILSVILIITILLAISTTVYIILKPNQGESFTEFYILGPNGKASDYPTNLTIGQNGSVIIGVVNHEYQTETYELVVSSNGTVMSQQNITLTNGNQTQIPYSFTAGTVGYKNIQFLLYKLPDTTNVYRSLHLYVNMT